MSSHTVGTNISSFFATGFRELSTGTALSLPAQPNSVCKLKIQFKLLNVPPVPLIMLM